MKNNLLYFLPRWLLGISLAAGGFTANLRADSKTETISPSNLGPTVKFYSGYAGEMHQLSVSAASGYKFKAEPSLSSNPSNLWSGSGSSFSLVDMEGRSEIQASVVGSITPTGTGGGDGGTVSEYPFAISMITRYFTMSFSAPNDTFILKGEKVPVSVSVVNAIGSPTSGSISFTSSLGSFGVNNPANVSAGVASGEMTVTANGGTKAKITANASNVDITDGETADGDVESQELTAVEATLISDPVSSLGVSAASSWPSQESSMTKADLILTVSPSDSGAVQKVKDDLTLEVEELTTGSSYTPTGLGSVTRQTSKDSGNKVYWQYDAFTEPQSEKHPVEKKANIVKKVNDIIEGSPLLLTVRPVFLTLTGLHQHAAGGSYHASTDADYESAANYVIWKYTVPVSDTTSLSYDSSQGDDGLTAYGGIVTLGHDAFSSENWCASAIGHENVHGGQPAIFFARAFYLTDWLNPLGPRDYYKLKELPGYEWMRDHASDMGLSTSELQKVINRIDQINRGEAPTAD